MVYSLAGILQYFTMSVRKVHYRSPLHFTERVTEIQRGCVIYSRSQRLQMAGKVKVKMLVAQSCLTPRNPTDCSSSGSSIMDFPGKNTGLGCHSLIDVYFLSLSLLFFLALTDIVKIKQPQQKFQKTKNYILPHPDFSSITRANRHISDVSK